MTAERDDGKFAQLVDAIGPYLDRVVIVGGWAQRLFRNHPLARQFPMYLWGRATRTSRWRLATQA